MKQMLGGYFFLMSIALFAEDNAEQLHVSVQSTQSNKVAVGLVTLGSVDHVLIHIIDRIAADLQWSGQVRIVHKKLSKLQKTSELNQLFEDATDAHGVSVALFVSRHGHDIIWRLYDMQELEMIAGQHEMMQDIAPTYLAHTITDKVWPYLFGQSSCFRSKIAYCKQVWRKKHGKERVFKQIWVADFDGSNPTLFIDAPTISFAPRWNNDLNFPLLFYSQNTMSNVQLVLSNMFEKQKVICCFNGLNMQPTFGDDGKRVVFCLSKDGTSQLYLSYIDPVSKKRIFDRLTFNQGNNIAPCFIDANTVAFVSDYLTDKPQIYLLNLDTKAVERVTDGGYCACPSYSKVSRQLVYSKMMGGGMQLFLYDFAKKEHKQLTFDAGSKEEACWSWCGNYVVYGWNKGHSARIAQLHLPTNTTRFLTPEQDHCTYPDCSPVYSQCLGILNR